jgi:hypothetical protein
MARHTSRRPPALPWPSRPWTSWGSPCSSCGVSPISSRARTFRASVAMKIACRRHLIFQWVWRSKERPRESRPLSYPLLVQPVLDRHCIKCHGGERTEGNLILTGQVPESNDGERSPFSYSYLALAPLVKYAQWPVFDEDFRRSNSEPVTKPDFFGSRSSPLITMLREGHESVELSDKEFERLITWADNNVLFYGTFDPEEQARQLSGKRIKGPLVD